MKQDYTDVTELAGDEVTLEQVNRLCNRYYWAGRYCKNRDIVEIGCGPGQGLGYLASLANNIAAGDISDKMLEFVEKHYKGRIPLQRIDAQNMPFQDKTKDVIVLFEAIYYLPDADQFVKECSRILRPNGNVLIASANKDLYDFNPSPYSHQYFGVVEMDRLLKKHGFKTEFFGSTPVDRIGIRQKMLRPIKKAVVGLGLMPRSMQGKKILKRLVFGNMVPMPAEIDENTSSYEAPAPIASNKPDENHKVIYCCATLGKE